MKKYLISCVLFSLVSVPVLAQSTEASLEQVPSQATRAAESHVKHVKEGATSAKKPHKKKAHKKVSGKKAKKTSTKTSH
jgi:Ni/Co efflux regulator RcnB